MIIRIIISNFYYGIMLVSHITIVCPFIIHFWFDQLVRYLTDQLRSNIIFLQILPINDHNIIIKPYRLEICSQKPISKFNTRSYISSLKYIFYVNCFRCRDDDIKSTVFTSKKVPVTDILKFLVTKGITPLPDTTKRRSSMSLNR